jgi:alpha-tubulin suppressor-like RCC1 family protein
MRFLEVPALITEDIEDPSIVEITEPITVSISGTTMTIDGGSKVSGEASVTLTGDVTVNAFTLQNVKQPSIHKISVKTNRKGNFKYVPNDTVTASSVSTTTKTGSDFEILLITTTGGETYVDFDMADYVSPALYTSNALTGFDISELTSTYGATAKLYKPDGTLLTTVTSATTGNGVNFGYTESTPQDVTYTLEVEDDLGRTSRYDLPRKWISYAMETNSTPGFQKFRLEGNDDDYTTTVMFPSLGSSSTAKVYRTSDHGYLGINFKIQGRNSTGDDWVDIANADEDDEVLAFGNYKYHRVWVKPTAKATTTVSSSNVVTLTLTDFTEENVTTSFTGADPYDINESTNTYVFEETTKIGTVPFTVTLGGETYTNAVSATTEGTAYDYVTLAFANPTLSLTTSNVTISSAKLYRDDVLFHTYGTESNVVLRSDQTGTYQAVVNDVYYSNRVVPDFTTTRSVSAPQLEFDGYNRLNLSNITPTSTTLGVPDGTTRDLTTQSNVYIYEPGTYTANVQTSETFAYLSNVVTSQPSQNPTDVGPTFTFDEYNRLAISNLTQTSSTLKYGSNTYDTNTASNVYVTDTGEYKLEARDANTFVMSNVYVGAVDTQVDYTNLTSMYYGGAVTDVNGVLYTWGHDGYGDSGRGASDRIPTAITTISDPVSNVWRGTPGYTVAAKTSTDKWYMWGRNTYSAVLGNTTNTGNVTAPEDVTAKVTEYFGDQTVSANKIIKMAMGEHHAVALTAGGKVWSWGGESQNWPFGSVGHALPGNGSPNYYECVSVSGTTYLYKRPNKPSDHGSEIKFVADSTTGSGRYTGTWQDASSVFYPNAFQDPSLHPTTSGTPSYTPTHNDTTLYLYNNENHDATCTVDYSTEMPVPFKNTTDGTTELLNIIDIQSLYNGTAALDSSGNVWFWGTNSTMSYTYPTKILDSTSIPDVVGMVTNAKSLYAWKSDGTFYTRGAGNYGQLANGSESDQYTSWQTVTTLQGKTIKKVFGGNENMFVWTDDGVYGVGRGNNYKNGDGSTGNNSVFAKSTTISALSIRDIDFGHATGLVLTTDGRGYMWGEDSSNSMANALSGNQSGAAEATSISALTLSLPLLPTLTFDGYNKLTIDNVDTVETATIKKDGAAFATTTSNTVYIRDTGTYTAEVKGSDEYAIELSKEVSAINNAPDITITFHYDTFTNSGDPYSDGSVTAAATAGHIFSDTDTTISYTWGTLDSASTANRQTTYTWTPASTVTAKVLMVAGGGGGGNSDNNNGGGGGGGAGGVVYNASVSLSGQQTIVVGGNNNSVTGNGSDTEFTGLTTAIGGGKGGGAGGAGASGGSGGGAFRNGTGSAGTEGQGYAGGDGSSTYSPSIDQGGSGGGGAGGAGAGANDANGANGGVGLDYSSVFGTTYGDSGWFASGGGGGFHSGSPGTASNGGGGNGGGSSGSAGANGQKHTGGGGGGGSIASGTGSYGGTGIVLVQFSPLPSITYDGKNKLTVSGTNYADTSNVTYYSNTYNLGTAKTMYVKDTGEYVFKISGTDKYAESNVYVSSVDLAGAPTKPIDFDGYNKLTLIDAGSNVLANVTYFSNTYELGSANVLYINGAGTYDLEMSGSNVFALSSNVVSGSVNSQRNATYKDFTYTETRIKSTWDNYDTTHSPPLDFTFKTGSDFNNSTLIGLGYTEGFNVSRWWIVSSDTHDFATHGTGTSVSHYNWGSDGTVAVNQGTEYAWFTRTIPSTVVDVSGTYKVNLGAQLTFDNYNKLTLENFTTVNDKQWPPTDGTRSSPTWSDSDKVADWTITGASYGNGSYKGTSSVAVWSDSSNHAGPYWAFNNDDSTADDECWHPQSIVVAILTIEMPSSMVLGSYELYYRNYTDYTCGPKDWTVEGSNDGSTWTVLDTRTNQPQVTAALAKIGTYTVSNSTSYSKYRLNVTENHGGDQTIIGEWKLFEKNTRTATLTDPNGNTYSLGQTQNDIYIEDTGEYILEVTNSDQSAVVKTNVGTVTEEVEVSPQLWWNTYTNSSTVDDSSPNNLDGTLNSVTDTDGAFTFDGSSSYIQMATTGATDSNVQLAMWDISCEFYKTGSGATGDYIDRQAVVLVTKGINAGDGQGYDINYGLVIDSNNKLCTGFEEAGSNQITIESTTTINNNQWYTARATFDGTTLNLYLDDTLEATATPTISPASSDLGPFMVGAGRYDTSRTPAAYFQGRIKNVKVYNDIFISVPQPPSLTFDGYNKLSIENLTPTSTRLTYGSNTYEIGTASNVYIEHEGTYKMATGDATTFALVSKEVGTQPSGTTYNLTSLTRVSNYSTTNTSKAQVSGNGTWPVSSFMATHNVLNNGDKAYGKTDGGSSRDPAQLFDTISSGWGEASHGTNGTHSPMSWGYEFTSGAKMISKMILYQPPNTHPAGNVTIKYWDGTSMTTVSNQSPIGMTSEVALSSTEFTFDAVSSQYWQIDCYRHATQTTGYTGLSEWEIYGNVITTINTPSLTYDTSNKLSIENLTPTSTILTDPNGSSFDIGTALNVYIRDSGTYSIASKDANTFVLTSNTVTGTPTGTTYTHTILTGSHTRISDRDASNTNRTHNSGSSDWPDSNSGITHYQDLSNGDRSYQKTNGGDSRDAAQLFDGVDSGNWGNASHGNVGTHSPMTWGYKFTSGSKQCSQMILVQPPNTHHAGNVTIKYWDGTSMTAVSNQSPLSMDNQTTDNDPTTFTFDAVSSQFWQIDCYRGSDNSTGYTGLHAWEIYDNPYEYVTGTTPSQTYDNTKTITVKNVPSTLTDVAGKIYKGSTAYTIHATTSSSNVIIKNTGSYVSVFTTATQAFLTNAIGVTTQPTTTSDDTTIEDEGFIPGSTAVPDETTTDAPSVTLDATDTTVTDPTLDLDFTATLPRTLKRYNGVTNSSIGARFNRHETNKKRIEKSISIPSSFSAELTANNASSPTTLTVTVANSKFVINGDETPTLGFIRGETYTFDQSDASNSGHPLVLATSEDGATQYTTGWTTTPSSPDYVPGVSGAQGTFIVPYDVPDTIYYKCNVHSNMGGEINTTFGNVFSLGDFTVAANTHVSGEYTLATNYDGTTSNLYVNGDLITQITPSPVISAGVKEFILGKEFDGYVKNFKFWNYNFIPPYNRIPGTFQKNGINGNSTLYYLLGARAVEATPWYSTYHMPQSTSKADAFAITSGGTSIANGGVNTSRGTYPTIDPGLSIGPGHEVANSFHFATDMTKVDKIYFLSANGTYGLEFSLQDYADVPAPATGGAEAGGTITITDKFGYTATSIYALKRVSNSEDPWINTGTTHNYTQMFYGDSTGDASGSHMSDNGGFYIYASLI